MLYPLSYGGAFSLAGLARVSVPCQSAVMGIDATERILAVRPSRCVQSDELAGSLVDA